MFLANQLLDFQHASRKAQEKRDLIIKRHFINAAIKNGSFLLAEALRHNRDSFTSLNQSIAALLPGAVRMQITPSVAAAWEKMDTLSAKTRYDAFQYARLPANPTWIEFPSSQSPQDVIGILLQEKGEGDNRQIIASTVMSHGNLDGIPMSHERHRITISSQSTTCPFTNTVTSAEMDKEGSSILGLLLLINSRSKILKVGDPVADPSTIKSLKGEFRTRTTFDLRPIEFDISRLIKGGQSAADVEKALQEREQSLVIGHFKIRKTGVFWWSPHWRNADDTIPRVVKDRNLIKSDGQSEQFRPDGIKLL